MGAVGANGVSIEPWGPERAADLADLVTAAAPAERLTADELLACCWDDPGLVLGTAGDPDAAVAAVVRRAGDLAVGFVRLLAVHPGRRRAGLGRRLLAEAEDWLFAEGVTEVQLGGSAPFYLWPGVDVQALPLLCLAEAAGYDVTGAELDLSLPTTFRAAVPPGVVVRRVLDEADVVAVRSLVEGVWPWWWPEAARGIDGAGCFAAFGAEAHGDDARGASGDVRAIGFACHSVNRAAWLGPMGVDPTARGRGIGHALLGAVAQDLMVAGWRDLEVAWIGPVRFYAAAGASVSRVFRTYRRRR